jgi:hypothetical protein
LVKVCEAVRFMVCSRGTEGLVMVLLWVRWPSSSAAEEVFGRYDRIDGLRCIGGVDGGVWGGGSTTLLLHANKAAGGRNRNRGRQGACLLRRNTDTGIANRGTAAVKTATAAAAERGEATKESVHSSRRGCVEGARVR